MNIKVCDRCGERIIGDCGHAGLKLVAPAPHHIDMRVEVHDVELCYSCCIYLYDYFNILNNKLKMNEQEEE